MKSGQCYSIYKDLKEDSENYRPVSLTSVPKKMMEEFMVETTKRHFKSKALKSRHRQCGYNKRTLLNNMLLQYDLSSRG